MLVVEAAPLRLGHDVRARLKALPAKSTVTMACFRRLLNHAGCVGAPTFDATTT